MTIFLSKRKAQELAFLWAERSPREQRLERHRDDNMGLTAVHRFVNWLDRYDIWLGTHNDFLADGKIKDEMKKLREWRRENKIK